MAETRAGAKAALEIKERLEIIVRHLVWSER